MRSVHMGLLLAVAMAVLAGCTRPPLPATASPDARPIPNEGARQTQRADLDKAVGAAGHVTNP